MKIYARQALGVAAAVASLAGVSRPNCASQWAGGTLVQAASATALSYADTLSGVDPASLEVKLDGQVADHTAPTVELEKTVLVAGSDDQLTFRYNDDRSGVLTTSIAITVDAADITAACFVQEKYAICRGPFAPGLHPAAIALSDRAGNPATGSFSFEIKPLASDQVSPELEMTTLEGGAVEGHTFEEQTFAASFSFDDADSGTEIGLLEVTVGNQLAYCGDRFGYGAAECIAEDVPAGSGVVVARLADRAGNVTSLTATATFTARTADTTGPEITFLRPDDSQALIDTPIYLHALFADDKSGLDRSTIAGNLDGNPQALQDCLHGYIEDDIECQLPDLPAGMHHLTLEASDVAGNRSVETLSFEVVATTNDRDPPAITFEAPAAGAALVGTGVDPASDPARHGSLIPCQAGAGLARCFSPLLEAGTHQLAATVEDLAGNTGAASLSFAVSAELADQDPPELSLISPGAATVYTNSDFGLSISYRDDGSGIDPASLQVSYDGQPIQSSCSLFSIGAACSRPPATGHHSGTIAISDRAGNQATLSFEFEVKAVSADTVAPQIVLTSEGAPLAGIVFPSSRFVAEIELRDEGSGFDIDSLVVEIDGVEFFCNGRVAAWQECSAEVLPGGRGPRGEERITTGRC